MLRHEVAEALPFQAVIWIEQAELDPIEEILFGRNWDAEFRPGHARAFRRGAEKSRYLSQIAYFKRFGDLQKSAVKAIHRPPLNAVRPADPGGWRGCG
jgi:hypothetical protein